MCHSGLVHSRCSISAHGVNNEWLLWGNPVPSRQHTLAAFIVDVMVIVPLSWKTYRGADKSFILMASALGLCQILVSRL